LIAILIMESSQLTKSCIRAKRITFPMEIMAPAKPITELMYNFITPYDIHEHIEKDNVAVGIGFAGAMISIGNVIRFALMHDFVSWEDSMINIAINVGIGLLFLPLVRILTDKILLPGQKLTDEIINQEHPNHGAALIEAFAYIGGSVLITWTL